jgi:23S rRNA G2445 N2-methylase RlmL
MVPCSLHPRYRLCDGLGSLRSDKTEALAGRAEFEDRLNSDAWGERTAIVMVPMCGSGTPVIRGLASNS